MRNLAIALAFALSAAACATTGAPQAGGGYDVSALNPTVRDAVLTARQREAEAQRAAATAREHAARAAEAAERARRGERGFFVDNSTEGQRYAGGWGQNGAQGHGVTTFIGGVFNGDSYQGEHADNRYQGYGVYNWANNENNTPGQLRFEGQFTNDEANGVGVRIYRDGQIRSGEVANWRTNGFGVQRLPTGWRYEGQFSGGQYQGYGVLWNPEGEVERAGLWQGGELVQQM